MRYCLALAVLLTDLVGARAQAVMVYGAGTWSCAKWQESQHADVAGGNWLLGFWSGENLVKSRQTGTTTDYLGIIGEIRKDCQEHPYDLIVTAAARVYDRLNTEN